MKAKDANLMAEHTTTSTPSLNPEKAGNQSNIVKNIKNPGNRSNTQDNEDYDFWSMPNNESGKKRKDFVADSGLWVNDKDIDKSVFITDQRTKK